MIGDPKVQISLLVILIYGEQFYNKVITTRPRNAEKVPRYGVSIIPIGQAVIYPS